MTSETEKNLSVDFQVLNQDLSAEYNIFYSENANINDTITSQDNVSSQINSDNYLNIKISDQGYSLYKDIVEDNFDAENWNSSIGKNLSNTIESLIANQNPEFIERWSNLEFTFINEMYGLSSLENIFKDFETDYQAFQNENSNLLDDIEIHFASLSDIDTLLRLETDGLVLSSSTENITLALKANNLGGDLITMINAYNNPNASVSSMLAESITGQINSLTLTDYDNNFSSSISFTNNDSNNIDAEELVFDVDGLSLTFEGSFPRDMANVFNLLSSDSGTSLSEKLESQGYDIDAIRLSSGNEAILSATQNSDGKIDFSLGGQSLTIEDSEQQKISNLYEILTTDSETPLSERLENEGYDADALRDLEEQSLTTEDTEQQKISNLYEILTTDSETPLIERLENEGYAIDNLEFTANDSSVTSISFSGINFKIPYEVLTDIKDISSTFDSFAAIKEDGSVFTWGDKISGGDSSSVSDQLSSNVYKITGN